MSNPKRKPTSKRTRRRKKTKADSEQNLPIDVLLLSCRSSPSYPALVKRAKAGKFDAAGIRDGIVQTWRELFGRLNESAAAPADVLAAIRYWHVWPRLWRMHLPAAPADWTVAAGDDGHRMILLDVWHSQAQRIIIAAAMCEGLDATCIARSGRLCHDELSKHPELGDVGGWPECLEGLDVESSPDNLKAIRSARDVLDCLSARLETNTGKNEDEDDRCKIVRMALDRLRRQMPDSDPSPKQIIEATKTAKKWTLDYLRCLEREGLYSGFARPRPPRYGQ